MKFKELDEIIKKIPSDKSNEAKLMYDKMVFILTECSKLEKDISTNGSVEHFVQGKQNFMRESPSTRTYINFLKQFDTCYKNLLNLIPKNIIEEDNFDSDEL